MFDSRFWMSIRTYTPSVTLGMMLFLMYAASSIQIADVISDGWDSISQLAGAAAHESLVPSTHASSTLVATTSSATTTASQPSASPKPTDTVQKPVAIVPVQEPHELLIPMSTTAIPVLPGQGGSGLASDVPAQTPPVVPTPTPPASAPTPQPNPTPAQDGTLLFSDSFSEYPPGVITNEYAYWNANSPSARTSANWELTAGTIFMRNGVAWTGVPDSGVEPDPTSSNANNSAIFRLTTKRADFDDVSVAFDLRVLNLTSTVPTPVVDWDGVHVFLRYQSQYHLYYASVNRRDNTVIIKKKIPGGPSNGGTYFNLSQGGIKYTLPFNAWQHVDARVQNRIDGSVEITLYVDGKLLTKAIDNGTIGGPPIRAAGKVGIRADNANMEFKNFRVSAL